MTNSIQILPSLLAADFGRLEAGAQAAQAAGADALHIDIMDGHFVPNISFGPDVVRMARRAVTLPLSVHLMLSKPAPYAARFIEAGADTLLIHIEAEGDIAGILDQIRARGVRPGITLNPDTPAEAVFPVLDRCDEVLVMTVHPGYGGQHFMNAMLPKIAALRAELDRRGRPLRISVDGGVDADTAPLTAAQGADTLIAGTFLYSPPGQMAARIRDLRERCQKAAADRSGEVRA